MNEDNESIWWYAFYILAFAWTAMFLIGIIKWAWTVI
jgi:hypothetical protein